MKLTRTVTELIEMKVALDAFIEKDKPMNKALSKFSWDLSVNLEKIDNIAKRFDARRVELEKKMIAEGKVDKETNAILEDYRSEYVDTMNSFGQLEETLEIRTFDAGVLLENLELSAKDLKSLRFMLTEPVEVSNDAETSAE